MKLQLYPGGDARLMQARAIDPAIVATAFGTRTSTLALACHRGLRALSWAPLDLASGSHSSSTEEFDDTFLQFGAHLVNISLTGGWRKSRKAQSGSHIFMG